MASFMRPPEFDDPVCGGRAGLMVGGAGERMPRRERAPNAALVGVSGEVAGAAAPDGIRRPG
ncbi:hypothetical protein GCM10009761_26410 [Agromyces terreus]